VAARLTEDEALLGTNHFRVVIGERELGFAEVSRISSSSDRDATADERPQRFETVVLRRALTRSTELYDWRRSVVAGKDDRRPVTIYQLDASGRTANAWRLVGAWPCRWSGPAFNALETSIAFEELELAFDDLVWLDDPTTTPGG
jgi:phage tail-like protein